MPKPTKGNRLGGSPAHERIILDNLASQLFEHGRIVTTETRAKRVRPLAEKLITKAKRGDLHARRLAATHIRDKGVLHVLFTEIAPAVADRDGGYTRITKIGPRKGDNAPMAVIEVLTEPVTKRAPARLAEPPAPVEAEDTTDSGRAPARLAEPAPVEAEDTTDSSDEELEARTDDAAVETAEVETAQAGDDEADSEEKKGDA